jgi:kumamolisin
VALINEHNGKPIGFLNPLLYVQRVEASGLHDITEGSNGAFNAAEGWDPCTGLGSPDGLKLMEVLTGKPTPQSASAARAGGSRKMA